MRYFWILDSRKPKRSKPCGLLSYDEESREFGIDINPEAGTEEVPMLFIPFIERGELRIPPNWALTWVQERIPPPNRQNIGAILEAHGLEEYDEMTLLEHNRGLCSQDDFMVREATFAEGGTRSFYDYAVTELPSETDINLKQEVGKELRRVRKEQKVSQTELTRRSGIPHATISRIENGMANPTLETLSALAEALGVTPSFKLE